MSLTWEGVKRFRTSRMQAHGRSCSTAGPGLKWCDALPVSETAGEREPRHLTVLELDEPPGKLRVVDLLPDVPEPIQGLDLVPCQQPLRQRPR